jgi:uncharacterized lipoprotein YajG
MNKFLIFCTLLSTILFISGCSHPKTTSANTPIAAAKPQAQNQAASAAQQAQIVNYSAKQTAAANSN